VILKALLLQVLLLLLHHTVDLLSLPGDPHITLLIHDRQIEAGGTMSSITPFLQ